MNLNFIGNTIDEIFGVKKKKDQVAAPQPIIRQQTLPSGLVVAKTPSQPTLTLKPAVNVKSPLTIGTPISMNNSIKIKAPTFTDNYSQPVSTTSRAKTLYQGIKQNQNIDDLSNRTGLGKQEILDFAKENGLDYGNKSILETAGEIAKGFVVDPFVNVAKDIAVKPAVTLARSLDPNAKKATQDALVAMDAAYKSGAISQAKLKEKFDDLMSDEISNGYKVTESGIEKMNPLGQTGQFAGQFVQAGSDVSNFLPFGIGKEQVKKLVMKPGEMAAKEILKTQAKQSAIIGTANTASDLLNDRGVTPESLAMNYAVPFVFGTVADTVHLRNKNAQFAKKSIDIIDKSYQATIKNGGVTIDLDGKSPTTGYVFSPDKTTELVVDKSNKKFNKKVISDFMTKNAGALMEKGNHLGIWEDDGKIYLDVSTVADRTPETIAKAQLAQQKGVFDLDNFETIDTGNIDENGVYSPLDEAVNIHNKYQEQIAGRIGETGDAGPTELPTSVQETPQGKNKVSFKIGQPASTPQVTKTTIKTYPVGTKISGRTYDGNVYHKTNEASIADITKNGLVPSKKDGRLYFHQTLQENLGWGEDAPIIRTRNENVPDLEIVKTATNNTDAPSSARSISPDKLEVSYDNGKTWKSLAPQVTKTEKNQVVINDKTMRDLGYRGNIVQESRGGSGEPPKRITSGEQDDIIKEVTKKVRSPLYQAKKGWAQMFNKAWVDEDQVVIDELRWIEKNTGQEGLVNKFIINSNNQRGSNAWANVYIKHNKNLNDAFGGMSKQEYNAFSDYVNARTELSTAKGRLTSRPVSELRQIVADGEEQFGSRFKSLNSYYKELADYAHKSGLITDEMHAKYKANDNYARIQRDMSDLADPYQGTSGRRRGISKSKMEQKRSGSEREILPAGDSAVTWAQTIFKEAARNKTCTHLVDTLMKTELANKLVDSTNVIARRKIFKTLSELKPVRDDLEKLIKQTVKELKKTNKVNFKRGQKILGTIKSKGGEYRNKAMKVANGGANLPGNSKKPAKLPTEADLEEAFYQFLDGNPGLLNDIEKFFTTKAQIKQLRQRLERAKDQFNQVKALRKDLYEDTLHMKDGSTKNKNIVSIKRNGIREVYEVSKEMKEAMDNINPFVINSFMRFIGAPARLFRAGTTGLEPTFVIRNYLKDEVGTAINSQSLTSTHNPARMSDGLLNATMDALGLNENPLWLEFQKFYGDMTSFDLTRNAKNTKEMVERIRGGKAAGVKQSMLHPIRTLEDYASITEKATRFQNFVGEYNRQIKAGMSHEDAVEQAALAAWQNSVDFSRAGTWGRMMNLVIPYWNPSIQGVRQMARVLKDRPIRSVFTASTLIGTPLILATAWNYSNQDSAEVYENIRETEKENNLVIVLPGTKVTDQDSKGNYSGVIKVPMAPGWKDVFMPTRRAMEAYYTKDPTKMAKMASDIIQAVSGPISTQSLEAFGGSLTPQFAKPWVQQAANKDLFSGNEIVPEWINEDTDADGNPIAESKKAYDGTSGIARKIGEFTNTSPIRVEKFIKDTTGKFGTEVLHGADTLAANADLIPEDQIGGTSIAGSFKQSFNEARGIKNYNASEGSKYYENVKEVTSNMTGNELSAFNTLHPSKTNFLGDTIYETNSIYNASARQDVYNRFPKVFEADKKIDAKNRSEGKVGNPLFDLTEEQRKKVLFKEALPPGAKDPELSNLYSQEWYVDYSNAKQAYFDGIQKDQQKELEQAKESGDVEKVSKITESIAKFNSSDNPYPEASAELQSVMDYYNSLAKGTGERSAWIRSHPNEWAAMQNQYAAIDNWQNKQRAKYGLDATEGAEGQANGYTSYTQSSGYSSGGSSGYQSHAKTPESYRVSINAGGQFKKPKVSSAPKVASLKVTHKYAEKPTVKLRKSKV